MKSQKNYQNNMFNAEYILNKKILVILFVSWLIYIIFNVVFIGNPNLLCYYSDLQYPQYYWDAFYFCFGAFLIIHLMLLLKIFLITTINRQIPLLFTINVITISLLSLSIYLFYGGYLRDHKICIDMFQVPTTRNFWGEWMANGFNICVITLFINETKINRRKYFVLGTFIVSIFCGFLLLIPQPYWSATLVLTFSIAAYLPMQFYLGYNVYIYRYSKNIQYYLSLWLSICFPLFTVNYLFALYHVIPYPIAIIVFEMLSLTTKTVFTTIMNYLYYNKLFLTEIKLQEEISNNEANKTIARRDFMKYLFHELRNPLNSLSLGIDLLLTDETLSAQNQEYINDIKLSSSHLTDILNKVLDIQKIEENKIELNFSRFDIENIMNKVFIIYKSKINEKNINMKLEINPTNHHKKNIYADKYYIEHVISNLLSNALKFSYANSAIEIHITFHYNLVKKSRKHDDISDCLEKLSQKIVDKSNFSDKNSTKLHQMNYMTFEIKNYGDGISEKNQKNIFNNFYQERPNHIINNQGSGLGLYFCKKIVELHDGSIQFISLKNDYTIFSFKIPIDNPSKHRKYSSSSRKNSNNSIGSIMNEPSISPRSQSSQMKLESTKQSKIMPLIELCVLVVDDVEMNCKLLGALLRKLDIKYDIAKNGLDAFKMVNADSDKYNMVIMDNLMPVMNGMEATQKMREIGYKYIIAGLTGNVLNDDIRNFLDCGADVVFAKPLKIDCLHKLVRYARTVNLFTDPAIKLYNDENTNELIVVPEPAIHVEDGEDVPQ